MDTITPEYEIIEIETPGRRRKITKFALAGVAVLGVGAALTSAAWSDNVLFGGSASSGELDLQGRGTAGVGNFESSRGDGDLSVTIPASAFTNVGPNVSDKHEIEVLNAGTVDLKIDRIAINRTIATGTLFDGGALQATVALGAVQDADRILEPGQHSTIEIIVSGNPAWQNADYINRGGAMTVDVHATSDVAAILSDSTS